MKYSFFVAFGRWALPIIAFYIIIGCGVSLIRGNKKTGTIGYLINSANGDKIPLVGYETSIGRSRACDIVLNYNTVSRFHAVITKRSGQWMVFDTHSKTGTYVNKAKADDINLTPLYVNNGDTLVFGNAIFTFYDPLIEEEPEEIEEIDNPALFDADDKFFTGEIILPDNLASGCSLINCITGDSMNIDACTSVLIGRDDECDIQINSPSVSRKHALLSRSEKGGWIVEDLNSEAGTLLNGETLEECVPIDNGDIIEICGYTLKFSQKG